MNLFLKSIVAFMMIVIPQIIRADMNLIDRVLFSDKAYAKEIEVKAYIITQEQACAALCDPPQQPIQLEKKDLVGEKTFLLLQVRNLGKKHAWGTIACRVPLYHVPIKVPIFDITSPEKHNTYLLHLGVVEIIKNEPGFPKISFEWDELYTK